MKRIILFISIAVVFATTSCEPTYEKEYSWAYPLAGDWVLNTYAPDKTGKDSITSDESFEIKIYNSSFGKDSIWIDDYATTSSNGHFWSMKFKVKADMSTKTFANTGIVVNAVNAYKIGIKLNNGKVVGNDSIRFEVQFQDDTTPYGKTYILAGRRINSYDDYMH
jgi:hypothetical protein